MVLKNAYLSICLLWSHRIATKFIQTQVLGLKGEALAAPVCFMLNMSPLLFHSFAGSLCPGRRHNQQPHHKPIHYSLHTFPVRKKYYHGLGHDSWETPSTPCHSCLGTVNSSRERAGSWGHRHLKIAATRTPELKSTSSWWFQQKSPSKAKPSTWEMPEFSEGWWHWSQKLKISNNTISCKNCKVAYMLF